MIKRFVVKVIMRSNTLFRIKILQSFFGITVLLVVSTSFSNAESKKWKLQQQIGVSINTDSVAVEIENALQRELEAFYPLCIDTVYGGYYSDINYKWELEGRQNKMIVTQARHVWTASTAGMFYKNNELIKTGAHGFKFLREQMWDTRYGGFFDLVTREGEPLDKIKKAYGNAFAIYGLAAYYKASGDTAALKLAQETFLWLEKHSYDKEFGGYFQFLSEEGEAFKEGFNGTPPKDQNSSIHLLEAFTELYKVWKDPLLKERLEGMLHLIRDVITTDKGYMVLFFSRDWKPVTFREQGEEAVRKNLILDHVSFGHDVETAYLMLEASEALGLTNDTKTLTVGKKMIDHALMYGWDKENGGIYDGGYYFELNKDPMIVIDTKEWWAEAEALNSFLLMSRFYLNDDMDYKGKFIQQWNYIKKYLLDNEYGGWYWGGTDKEPESRHAPKASIWKADYHTARAMMNCLKMLKENQAKK